MKCFNCTSETNHKRFDIPICRSCESGLKLFSDDTILRQNQAYTNSENPSSYSDEITRRLLFIEKDYLKKKIKLLHVLDRLESLK